MGTNGIVSVVKDRKVIVKAVAGCNGFNAYKLKRLIMVSQAGTVASVVAAAHAVQFGCPDCLVVFTSDGQGVNLPDDDDPEGLNRYLQTFSDTEFNPRWARGEASYKVVADLDFVPGRSIFDEEE